MTTTLDIYRERRDALLAGIAGDLAVDERFAISQTSPERLSLFSQFGTPALIHENNHNAPEGGTFTFILYSGTALMVDWTLLPQSQAKRPPQSKLLFDKIDIPPASPPGPDSLEQSKKTVAEPGLSSG